MHAGLVRNTMQQLSDTVSYMLLLLLLLLTLTSSAMISGGCLNCNGRAATAVVMMLFMLAAP